MLLELSSSTEGADLSLPWHSSGVLEDSVASPEAVDALLGLQPTYNGRLRSLADSVSALDMLESSAVGSEMTRVYDASAVGASLVGLQHGVARALSFANSNSAIGGEADSDVSSIHSAHANEVLYQSDPPQSFNALVAAGSRLKEVQRQQVGNDSFQRFYHTGTVPAADSTWETVGFTPLDDSIDIPTFKTVRALNLPKPEPAPIHPTMDSSSRKPMPAASSPPSHHQSAINISQHQSPWVDSLFSPLQAELRLSPVAGGPKRVPHPSPAALPPRVKSGPKRVRRPPQEQPGASKGSARRRARRRRTGGAPAPGGSGRGVGGGAAATAASEALPHAARYAAKVLASSAEHDTPGRLSASSGRSSAASSRRGPTSGGQQAVRTRRPGSKDRHRRTKQQLGIQSSAPTATPLPPHAAVLPPPVPPRWHAAIPPQPPRVLAAGGSAPSTHAHAPTAVDARGRVPPPPGMHGGPQAWAARLRSSGAAPAAPAAQHRINATVAVQPADALLHTLTHAAVVPSVAKRAGAGPVAQPRRPPPRTASALAKSTQPKPRRRNDPVARYQAMQAVWSSNVTGPGSTRRRRRVRSPKKARGGGSRGTAVAAAAGGNDGTTPWLRG